MLRMQPWCWNRDLSCARQCSEAGSGTFQVLRQIPLTISKPVFLSAGYNFAKKGISAMKAEAMSLPYSVPSHLCVRRRLKEQLLKYLCVHKVLYLPCISRKCQDYYGKNHPPLLSQNLSLGQKCGAK